MYSKSGITGSYISSIYNFLNNQHIPLHNGCTILYFPKQCICCLFSTSLPKLFISCLFNSSNPNMCEVIFHIGFNSNYLVISDAEHLCMYPLVTCMSWKICNHVIGSYFNFFFFLLSCINFLYVLH